MRARHTAAARRRPAAAAADLSGDGTGPVALAELGSRAAALADAVNVRPIAVTAN